MSAEIKQTNIGPNYSIVFSHDGTKLVSIGRNISIWDALNRKKLTYVHPFSHPSDADFSPDDAKLAIKNTAGRIILLSTDTADVITDFRNTKDGEGCNLLFSSCGEYIIDGSWNGRLMVRKADSGKLEFCKDFPGEMIESIEKIKSSDKWLVRHGIIATIHDQPPPPNYFSIWQWPFQKNGCEQIDFRASFVSSSAISPKGDFLAVMHGAPPINLSVYDMVNGKIVCNIPVKSGGAINWSFDGQYIGSVQNNMIVFYNFPSMRIVREVTMEYPSDVVFSPQHNMVAMASWKQGKLVNTDFLKIPS